MKERAQQKKLKKLFSEVYDRYHQDIFRFVLLKTSDRSLSLDITQETFLKLWEYLLRGIPDDAQIRALLYRIARNLVVDSFRKKQAQLVGDSSTFQQHHHFVQDDQQRMEDRIDGEMLISLLQELPEGMRELLILRYLQSLSIQEIAQLTGKKENTVSVGIHRALKRFREIVSRKEEAYGTS